MQHGCYYFLGCERVCICSIAQCLQRIISSCIRITHMCVLRIAAAKPRQRLFLETITFDLIDSLANNTSAQ